jgi:hypothetical protein
MQLLGTATAHRKKLSHERVSSTERDEHEGQYEPLNLSKTKSQYTVDGCEWLGSAEST